ncbi:MAG: DUF4150 domain-containing protein [Polyangiaceae bacterium]|nr:DUF4150 domain-containing protein [Polyangiaceae bacterium]
MADNEGVRTTGEAIVKCTTPDVCKTPPSMSPVPYEIIGRFSDGVLFSDSVCMTGLNVMTTASRLPKVYGDEAGTGGGVTSGVNVGYCKPITHSPTVRAQGDFIVFHSAEYWMNCSGPDGPGNTKGTVVYVDNVDAVHIGPLGDIEGETNPPAEPETEKEKSWWETALDWTHTALDVVGLVPVLGEVADGANAIIHGVEAGVYAATGNDAKAKENALMATLSVAAMWPVGGQAATGTKLAIKVGKELVEEGAEKAVKEGIEEGIEQAAKKEVKEEVAEKSTKNGVKVTKPEIKSAAQCRTELKKNLGDPPGNLQNPQAHHDLPVKYQEEFVEHGIDINKAENGRWVEGTPPGRHQNWSKEFNDEWQKFFDEPNIPKNKETILEKMNDMRNDPRFQ